MKMQWMLALAMVAGITACSKSESKKKAIYGYHVSESSGGRESCKSEHWFNSEAERCAALPNDAFNNYCNPEGRANLFESHNCDKSLAANSSIRHYFAENGGRTKTTVRLRDNWSKNDSLELEVDADGCYKGSYKFLSEDLPKCKGRY